MEQRLFGLCVQIFGDDCTNGGVTSGKELAVLCGKDLNGNKLPECFEAADDCPALEIRPGRGMRAMIAVPAGTPSHVYPQFGGHFIYAHDSRFPSDQPIHVHDRFE